MTRMNRTASITGGRLLDRWIDEHGRGRISVQRTDGCSLTVSVQPEDMAAAAALCGGAHVSYAYRGGRPRFVADDCH